MERIAESVVLGGTGWSRFFEERGTSWRDKDYWYLNSVFNLSQLSGSLLDAGCALGDGLLVLRRRCRRAQPLSGMDFSPYAIDANGRNPALMGIHFFQHDLHEPIRERYNTVVCLQTLEHLSDPLSAFANLYHAADELLIVASPYRNRRPDGDHLWSFDEKDFCEFNPRWILAQKESNIYWLCDKQRKGFRFRGKQHRLAGTLLAAWQDVRRQWRSLRALDKHESPVSATPFCRDS